MQFDITELYHCERENTSRGQQCTSRVFKVWLLLSLTLAHIGVNIPSLPEVCVRAIR